MRIEVKVDQDPVPLAEAELGRAAAAALEIRGEVMANDRRLAGAITEAVVARMAKPLLDRALTAQLDVADLAYAKLIAARAFADDKAEAVADAVAGEMMQSLRMQIERIEADGAPR